MAQGTIYPDRIESLNITGKTIKSHHNVGGLPEEMNLRLCEPLQWLFKDEVRRVGRELGMPEHLITRHPFPGPGLAVRILGDITREKVQTLQEADDIFIRGLRDWKVKDADGNETSLYHQVWQAGVILLPVQSVGVMGDERTYERAVALRAVTSTDAMTADWPSCPTMYWPASPAASLPRSPAPTACATTSRPSRPRPSSGNSENWLLNSRFGAAEYRLILFRHRRRTKPPAK